MSTISQERRIDFGRGVEKGKTSLVYSFSLSSEKTTFMQHGVHILSIVSRENGLGLGKLVIPTD